MSIKYNRKPAAKQPAHSHATGRKHAYAEQRLIRATDRYIAERTAAGKEKARKWIHAWHTFRTYGH